MNLFYGYGLRRSFLIPTPPSPNLHCGQLRLPLLVALLAVVLAELLADVLSAYFGIREKDPVAQFIVQP